MVKHKALDEADDIEHGRSKHLDSISSRIEKFFNEK
jgi:hypothetical protein